MKKISYLDNLKKYPSKLQNTKENRKIVQKYHLQNFTLFSYLKLLYFFTTFSVFINF